MEKGDVVRCLLCAELLSYDRAESETLIAHLQDRHPYIHVAQSADILINSESNLVSDLFVAVNLGTSMVPH